MTPNVSDKLKTLFNRLILFKNEIEETYFYIYPLYLSIMLDIPFIAREIIMKYINAETKPISGT